ncbi:lytic transglycosylase domain-containing protein [Paraconexibacter algicola]|uniref:Lytic transglycosylase domain-containing protein n=1 Tax=Paraconexibacter algicola TaxID=2133960 RepID=A0A2T4UEK7_9ACTN|nr:lytic transglycosylase domain-containing protein [Paraconexibacter algicola]PTL56219.1 lytic transglycosylase domain-containing protein [Paraconexibacter algicola]
MSPRPATATHRAAPRPAPRARTAQRRRVDALAARRAAAARRRQLRRRRAALVVTALLSLAGGGTLLAPTFNDAVQEITLPLKHEDIIRQQAADKGLDPALIAAVIFAESHFRDQTSSAGAKGLMQLTPATAHYIADKSGGVTFETGDLSTPQVNISYGSYYLRYLLDKYEGNTTLALAAYNGGEGNVDRWRSERGGQLRVQDIPFPETRTYVAKVQQARRDYRTSYAAELGL